MGFKTPEYYKNKEAEIKKANRERRKNARLKDIRLRKSNEVAHRKRLLERAKRELAQQRRNERIRNTGPKLNNSQRPGIQGVVQKINTKIIQYQTLIRDISNNKGLNPTQRQSAIKQRRRLIQNLNNQKVRLLREKTIRDRQKALKNRTIAQNKTNHISQKKYIKPGNNPRLEQQVLHTVNQLKQQAIQIYRNANLKGQQRTNALVAIGRQLNDLEKANKGKVNVRTLNQIINFRTNIENSIFPKVTNVIHRHVPQSREAIKQAKKAIKQAEELKKAQIQFRDDLVYGLLRKIKHSPTRENGRKLYDIFKKFMN